MVAVGVKLGGAIFVTIWSEKSWRVDLLQDDGVYHKSQSWDYQLPLKHGLVLVDPVLFSKTLPFQSAQHSNYKH